MGVSGQHHAPAALYPRGIDPGTHWTRGWVGPRAGLDAEARRKILCLCRGSNPGLPVRSQTLYRLSYPGSPNCSHRIQKSNFDSPCRCSSQYRLLATINTSQRLQMNNSQLINYATWFVCMHTRYWYWQNTRQKNRVGICVATLKGEAHVVSM
jgi:hypothetical protein